MRIDPDVIHNAITEPSGCDASDGSIYFRFESPVSGGSEPHTLRLLDPSGQEISLSYTSYENLSAGRYTLEATDASNCRASQEFDLAAENAISIDFGADKPCGDENNGAIELYVNTQGGYEVVWDDGSTDIDRYDLLAGNYCVTVTNEVGCEATGCFELEAIDDEITVVAEITDECSTRLGSIDLDVMAGFDGPNSEVTVLWEDGSTRLDRRNLEPGEYCVAITRCNTSIERCYVVNSITVEAEPISVSQSIIGYCPDHRGSSRGGAINLMVSGGGGDGFDYQWSNGYQGRSPRNLSAGQHCVTITDRTECVRRPRVTRCFNVPTIEIEISLEDIAHCVDGNCQNALISVSGASSTGQEVSFDWLAYPEDGSYYQRFSQPTISDLISSGEYCVTAFVRGPGACSVTRCFTIESDCSELPPLPDFDDLGITVWPTSPGYPDGAIGMGTFPNAENVNLTWTGPDGFTSDQMIINPAAGPGEYTLTIDDGCNEPISRTYTLDACEDVFDFEVVEIFDDCAEDGYARVTVLLNNLTVGNSYSAWNGSRWVSIVNVGDDNPDTFVFGPVPINGGPGNYVLTVRDQNRCVNEITVTVRPGDRPTHGFDYFSMALIDGAFVPTTCNRAVYCGEELVDIIRGPRVEPEAYQTPGGCEIRAVCSRQIQNIVLSGTQQFITTPNFFTNQCETGNACVAEGYITNPIFATLNGVDPQTLLPTRMAVALDIPTTSPMTSEYRVEGGNCVEVFLCNGQEVGRSQRGIATIINSSCERDNNGYAYCARVTVCDGQKVLVEPNGQDINDCCLFAITTPDSAPPPSEAKSLNLPVKYIDASKIKNTHGLSQNLKQLLIDKKPLEGLSLSNDILISPNPFSDYVSVSIRQNSLDEATIQLFSVNGDLLLTQKALANENEVITDFLPPGVYIAQVRVEDITRTFKIVKL